MAGDRTTAVLALEALRYVLNAYAELAGLANFQTDDEAVYETIKRRLLEAEDAWSDGYAAGFHDVGYGDTPNPLTVSRG